MVVSFVLFSFISLLMSGGHTSDLCHFSLVCSVVLGFSSVLVLVFTFVFIQGLLYFISVEWILLRFSWNVTRSLAFKFINFSISFGNYQLKCYPGVVDLLFMLH